MELSTLINEQLKDLLDFDYSTVFLFSVDKVIVDDFLFTLNISLLATPFASLLMPKILLIISDQVQQVIFNNRVPAFMT